MPFCLRPGSDSSNSSKRVFEYAERACTSEAIVYHLSGTLFSRHLANFKLFQQSDICFSTSAKRSPVLTDRLKLLVEICLKNSSFVDSGSSLHAFISRTTPKLHKISVFAKMVPKVITTSDSAKASGLDCVQVMVFKNAHSELSYT